MSATKHRAPTHIGDLLALERTLQERGEHVTCAEWIAYYEAKAEAFDKLAAEAAWDGVDGCPHDAAHRARDTAAQLRAEAAEWGWW